MLTRRSFIKASALLGASLFLPSCVGRQRIKQVTATPLCTNAVSSLREEYDYEAIIEGRIPPLLRGTLYRNGSGLFERDGYKKRTLLDGDGMIQSFVFHNGGVSYKNMFVRTGKYLEESMAGRFLYPTWSTRAPGGLLANIGAGGRIKSQAGISVREWNDRLYAFDESNPPYEIDPATLSTVGKADLGPNDTHTLFSGHPKADLQNSEWLHFGLDYGASVALHLNIFDSRGSLKKHRVIKLPRYVYMHDFFVSDSHMIFNLHPMHISPYKVALGLTSIAESLSWRPEEGGLIMILPRDCDGEPVFVESDAKFMWHSINAFGQGGEIFADFIGYDTPDHMVGPDPAVFAVMSCRKGNFASKGAVHRWRINPKSRRLEHETISPGDFEWPYMNGRFLTHRYRTAYMAERLHDDFFWTSVARVDTRTGHIARYDFGEGVQVTEPVFVPMPGFRYTPNIRSEPGWLLVECNDLRREAGFLAILDAEHLVDGPVARVMLNHNVPFSFHGCWSPSRDIL